MRIIAGSARRLPLKTVEGRDTRPTSDRIKETLFNILSPSLPGCRFLDLFAGSGQMGLEAASRGAKDVVLVENSRKAAACIEGNISFTKLGDSCTLLVMDAALVVRRMEGQEPPSLPQRAGTGNTGSAVRIFFGWGGYGNCGRVAAGYGFFLRRRVGIPDYKGKNL